MFDHIGKCTAKALAAIASIILLTGLFPVAALADPLESSDEKTHETPPAIVEENADQNGTSNYNPESKSEPEAQLLAAQGEGSTGKNNPLTTASTGGKCGDNLTWTLDDNGVLTISGSGDMYDRESGGAPWYEFRDSITNVVIGNGVVSIGINAFNGCTSLTNVTIPENVNSIDDHGFEGCSSLESVTIEKGVEHIGAYAFNGCTSLTSVTIPTSVNTVGNEPFYRCTSLSSLLVPINLQLRAPTTTAVLAYEKTGDAVILIDVLQKTASISIPEGVTAIGDASHTVFQNKTGIESIDIPASVTSIGPRAFDACEDLSHVTGMTGVETIGGQAFKDCKLLTSVTIPDSVTSIGDKAFEGCTSLKEVRYTGSRDNVSPTAFPNTTVHYMCGENLEWTLDDKGVLAISKLDAGGSGAMYDYENANDVPWYGQRSEITKVVIGSGVTNIGRYAFLNCGKLTSVEIPEGVKAIGKGAFELCSKLPRISIPSTVTSIGEATFYGCNDFDEIVYGGSKSQWDEVTLGKNWADNPDVITITFSKWDVTASASPAAGGGIQGEGAYANEAMAELKAVPYEGYEFVNWTEGGTVASNKAAWEFEVKGDRTLVANFKPKQYTITWEQDDGALIDKTAVEHGAKPTHADPTKKADEHYTYTFAGWEPEVVLATKSVTYKATYTSIANKYKVTFVDEDGTVLKAATEYDYGTKTADIAKPADPTKAADEKYSYEFAGWSPVIADVTADATYKATYKAIGKYPCAEGSGQSWAKGSNDPLTLTFKQEGDNRTMLDRFEGIEVDGQAVSEKDASGNANWTAKEGSLILSLQPSFLGTLAEGEHSVKVLFDDGSGEAMFKVASEVAPTPTPGGEEADATKATSAAKQTSSSPKTGDARGGTIIALSAMAACALCLALVAFSQRRRRHHAYTGKHARK